MWGLMATFEFLRLSLSVPVIGPLDNTEETEPIVSRQEYLMEIFGERHDFYHRQSLFSFVPAMTDTLPDGVLAGFIGRQIKGHENAGPESFFALIPHKAWKAAFITIDTNKGEQVISMERRHDVGASHSILDNFFNSKLRDRKAFSWHIDTEYITGTEAFWSAVEKHRGCITELAFTFYPPNGLKGFDKFKEFDRLAKQQTNSEKSDYTLKNSSGGVDPKGEFVEGALEYASEGAGQVVMKSGRKKIYSSRNSKKTDEIPESLMPRQGEDVKVSGVVENLKRTLNKGKNKKASDG